MPNVELLERTIQFIKDNPDKHDQTNWCGTSQCFAGWAATLSGWRAGSNSIFNSIMIRDDGQRSTASEAAMAELGITLEDATTLFEAGNEVEDLELMVKDIINGEPARPPRWRVEEHCLLEHQTMPESD